ncbi:MAG TPA: tripartite tricarboxylate transporter substrate binding protein [Ideonella sp.]|nr:tripartite tricarboxylate transporter substrate binding protein [Ideonella sp.]
MMSHKNRRHLLKLAAASTLSAALTAVYADEKPLRLIVITPPGAIVDSSSRTLAEGLRVRLGRPVLVENRTGAGGNIASDFVAKSAPDGNTLLVTSNNHTTNAFLYKSLPYDAEKDLVPVAHTVDFALAVAAHPTVKVSTIAELIALAKSNPDGLSFGSGGNGSPGHIAMELLEAQAGIKLQHIPYKGAAAAMTDAVAGQTQFAAGSLSSALPFVKSGQLKVLAVSGRRRAASAPAIPTMIESGLGEYDYTGWIGIMAPRGTPAALVQSLHEQINAVTQTAEFRKSVELQGGEAIQQSITEFSAMLKTDFERNRALIRAAGIRLD